MDASSAFSAALPRAAPAASGITAANGREGSQGAAFHVFFHMTSTEPTETDSAATSAVAATKPDSEVRLSDGRLMPIRDAPVGGQAVLEGVMMRGVSHWAVAVREPADRLAASPAETVAGNGASPNGAAVEVDPDGNPLGPILIHRESFVSKIKQHRFYRLPVVRGWSRWWSRSRSG